MRHYPKIDGLRCVAILLVLVQHIAWDWMKDDSLGYYGVDLFFVISGFLITSILLETKNASFSKAYYRFMGRRVLRIFPIYYLTLLILWIAGFEMVRTYLIWLLTYTYNYAIVIYSIQDTPINPFWSLCVEEQFYVFWPLIVLPLRKYPNLLLATIVLVVTTGFIQTFFNIIPSIQEHNPTGTLTRMSSIGIGSLGAIYSSRAGSEHKILNYRWLEAVVIAALLISLYYPYTLKTAVLPFLSLFLVLKAAGPGFSFSFINSFLEHKKVLLIGTISYGLYVYHGPFIHYFSEYIFTPLWKSIDFTALGPLKKIRYHSVIVRTPMYFSLLLGVAWLSYRYIEQPLLKKKDQLFR